MLPLDLVDDAWFVTSVCRSMSGLAFRVRKCVVWLPEVPRFTVVVSVAPLLLGVFDGVTMDEEGDDGLLWFPVLAWWMWTAGNWCVDGPPPEW